MHVSTYALAGPSAPALPRPAAASIAAMRARTRRRARDADGGFDAVT